MRCATSIHHPPRNGASPLTYRTCWLVAAAAIAALAGCGVNEIEPTITTSQAANSEAAGVSAGRSGAPVQAGLDRIAHGEVQLDIEGPVGLVTHAAAVAADGKHAIDVLLDNGVDLVRLFAPEHGLRGRAAAGEHVADGRDTVSGLPVVSLYGEHRKPQPEHLRDLEALVVDLQGAGVRFYTYVSTLLLSLEAAAEADVELIVLDRPNPLGGERIEGPVAAPRDVVPASFVNMAPGPLVHGLTFGEMARYANSLRQDPVQLTVVPMRGWQRWMTWRDTGRTWLPPSPNLRSPEAALAYPGIALLEATNVSEGRGTATPFLIFGAPWLQPQAIDLKASWISGMRLIPTEFTPRSSESTPNPKYVDDLCRGWRVEIVDRQPVYAYGEGLRILSRLSRQTGFVWRREGEALTWLLGTPRVYESLIAGRPTEEILFADEEDHHRWLQQRQNALLY